MDPDAAQVQVSLFISFLVVLQQLGSILVLCQLCVCAWVKSARKTLVFYTKLKAVVTIRTGNSLIAAMCTEQAASMTKPPTGAHTATW